MWKISWIIFRKQKYFYETSKMWNTDEPTSGVIVVYTLRMLSSPSGLLFASKVVALPLIPYSYTFLLAKAILSNEWNMLLLVHFHREAFRKIPNLGFSCRNGGLESSDYDSITLLLSRALKFFVRNLHWVHICAFRILTWRDWVDWNQTRRVLIHHLLS